MFHCTQRSLLSNHCLDITLLMLKRFIHLSVRANNDVVEKGAARRQLRSTERSQSLTSEPSKNTDIKLDMTLIGQNPNYTKKSL